LLFLGQKTLFLSKKTCFGVKVQKTGSITGVGNIPNLWKIRNLFFSELSKNYEKITLKLNFGNREKLFQTQKPTRMFGLKFGMQGLRENACGNRMCNTP